MVCQVLRSPRDRRKREEAVQGNTAGALKALVCSMAFFGGHSSASRKFGRNDVSHWLHKVNNSNHTYYDDNDTGSTRACDTNN